MEKLQPKFTRLDRDVDLVAPPGCHASVLLKLVEDSDGHRYYSWWALAGRHATDQISVPYKYTGENVIRCDLPEGMPLSAASLEPHLTAYLTSEQVVAGLPARGQRNSHPGLPPPLIQN